MKNGGKRPGAGRKSLSQEQRVFGKIYKFLPQAIKFLQHCYEEGDEDLKKWATEITLKKTIPDKKAIEVSGGIGEPIIVKIIGDYAPKRGGNVPSPKASPKD